jgi:hypothetical protein
MGREKDLKEEIGAERKRLEEEIRLKEKEADARLDQLLSRRKMEFCPRCGRKISSRSQWGGRCLHDGCEEMVCTECWSDAEKRFCKKHAKDFVRKEEATEDEIKNLTLNYMDFIAERLKKHGLDWTPEGFIRKSKIKTERKRYKEFEMVVCEKRMLSKKPKISVVVRPVSPETEAETNELLEDTEGVYRVIVFVGTAASMTGRLRKFAEDFSNKRVSLFLADMESGNVHFNPKEKITEKYASWFDPAKAPQKFADLLKGVSESVTGRRVIAAKAFSSAIGVSQDEAARILRQSGLVEEVKGADSFIIRE